MDIYTQENLKIIRYMEKEKYLAIMETFIKAVLLMIKRKVMVNINTKMELYTKENGKMIRSMVKEKCLILMEVYILVDQYE